MHRRSNGLTLIEVMVVMIIIVLLVALLLPNVTNARAVARNAVCMSNLSQIGKATLTWRQDNALLAPGKIRGSEWTARLTPYLMPGGKIGTPKVFLCPEDDINKKRFEPAGYFNCYSGSNFLYEMSISECELTKYYEKGMEKPTSPAWMSKVSDADIPELPGYLLGFEDIRQATNSDLDFDDIVAAITRVPEGIQIKYLIKEASYSYDLCLFDGTVVKKNFKAGESAVLPYANGSSYGMNSFVWETPYFTRRPETILVIDFDKSSAKFVAKLDTGAANYNANSMPLEDFDNYNTSGKYRFARHNNYYNALRIDGAVITNVSPRNTNPADPFNGTPIRQKYWGEK